METVETILDPLILAAAGVAVLLLVGVLVGISRITATNKQIVEQQKTQNNLLLTISNVLTSAKAEAVQARTEAKLSEQPGAQE